MHNRIPVFKKSYSVILLFFCQAVAFAQPGSLDSTFNGNGRVYTTNPAGFMLGNCNALQADGKILVAGTCMSGFYNHDGAIVRYKENGSLDSSFGVFGTVITDFGNPQEEFKYLIVQPDGKIIAGGSTDIASNSKKGILVRYRTNGQLDSSFGTNGVVVADFNSGPAGSEVITFTKLLNDGKILVGGSGSPAQSNGFSIIARYLSNGMPDPSFGNNGILTVGVAGNGGRPNIQVANDGKFYVTGYNSFTTNSFEFSRYLSNGQPDLSFNGQGFVQTIVGPLGGSALYVKLQPDNKILAAGIVRRMHNILAAPYGSDLVLVRYFQNGNIDSSFGQHGIAINNIDTLDFPAGIALQSDGKILVGGTASPKLVAEGPYFLCRYSSNGHLDNNFGSNGTRSYGSMQYFDGTCYGIQLKGQRIYLSGWINNIPAQATGFYTLAIQNDGIPLAPSGITYCPGAGIITLVSNMTGNTHQWQESTDSVSFIDIPDNSYYSGVTTPTLSVNNIPTSWYGKKYRCITSNGISNTFTIKFSNSWIGGTGTLWSNPANWSCGSLPDSFTDVVINNGTVIINSNVTVRSLTLGPGAALTVAGGYNLTVLH